MPIDEAPVPVRPFTVVPVVLGASTVHPALVADSRLNAQEKTVEAGKTVPRSKLNPKSRRPRVSRAKVTCPPLTDTPVELSNCAETRVSGTGMSDPRVSERFGAEDGGT
jgi:hypothetical protein